jgi:hypothetical protein
MAKQTAAKKTVEQAGDMTPIVAAELAGVVYRAKLENRAAKLNISEDEVVDDVIRLYRVVEARLKQG